MSSVNRRKLKELAISLNYVAIDQTEGYFLYLQWCLALKEHVEKRLFVNKQDTPKQYQTTNNLNIFFHKEKELQSSILIKFCDIKMFFLSCNRRSTNYT